MAKFRIRMKSQWTGTIDGVKRVISADEEVDVDEATCRALVYVHNKADLVTVEEIEAAIKKPKEKKPTKQTASTTKNRKKPPKNKMVETSSQK